MPPAPCLNDRAVLQPPITATGGHRRNLGRVIGQSPLKRLF
jgi:hypothetical protein